MFTFLYNNWIREGLYMLDVHLVTKMSSTELFESLLPVINKIYDKYFRFFADREKYKMHVLNEIERTHKQYHYEIDYGDYLQALLKEFADRKLEEYLGDSKKSNRVINGYIQSHFKNVNNEKDSLTVLDNLDHFLRVINSYRLMK